MKRSDAERLGRIAWWVIMVAIWIILILGTALNWWVIIDEGAKAWAR